MGSGGKIVGLNERPVTEWSTFLSCPTVSSPSLADFDQEHLNRLQAKGTHQWDS